ncbi:MAG TPA: YceI family protein [Chryseosolibacter sp.]|nr:YceI family protein [Chryseosolibacter sp.]
MRYLSNWQRGILLLAAAIFVTSCEKAPKGDKVIITDQVLPKSGTGETFIVDTAKSWIRFTGHGVGKNHPGTFKLNYGKVTAQEDRVTGGTFVMDITSLDMEQEGEMIDNKLKPHLLSGDFFDAESFGTSQFEITHVEPYKPKDNEKSLVEGANFMISGNLQIKSVTKNITFPARIDLDGERLQAKADFDIDRRQWQMNYGNDKTLGDNFISETVNVTFLLQARSENEDFEGAERAEISGEAD